MKGRLLHLDSSPRERAPFRYEADRQEVVDLGSTGLSHRFRAGRFGMRGFEAGLFASLDAGARATFPGSGEFHHPTATPGPLAVLHFFSILAKKTFARSDQPGTRYPLSERAGISGVPNRAIREELRKIS